LWVKVEVTPFDEAAVPHDVAAFHVQKGVNASGSTKVAQANASSIPPARPAAPLPVKGSLELGA
jgi:hypothetical protein